MDIKPTDKKDKLIIFFDEIKSGSVESAVKDLCKINIDDREYVQKKQGMGREERAFDRLRSSRPCPVSLFNLWRLVLRRALPLRCHPVLLRPCGNHLLRPYHVNGNSCVAGIQRAEGTQEHHVSHPSGDGACLRKSDRNESKRRRGEPCKRNPFQHHHLKNQSHQRAAERSAGIQAKLDFHSTGGVRIGNYNRNHLVTILIDYG